MSDDEGYIIVHPPNNPNLSVRAKVQKYKQTKGENFEFELENGTKIILVVEIDTISRPIDPKTNDFMRNPRTGEPVFNVNWGMKVKTVYSEAALNEIQNRDMR